MPQQQAQVIFGVGLQHVRHVAHVAQAQPLGLRCPAALELIERVEPRPWYLAVVVEQVLHWAGGQEPEQLGGTALTVLGRYDARPGEVQLAGGLGVGSAAIFPAAGVGEKVVKHGKKQGKTANWTKNKALDKSSTIS